MSEAEAAGRSSRPAAGSRPSPSPARAPDGTSRPRSWVTCPAGCRRREELRSTHAAIAFSDAQELERGRTAVSNRDLIGQAEGILMERYERGPQEAFRLLVMASRTTDITLLAVTDHLAETGRLASPAP